MIINNGKLTNEKSKSKKEELFEEKELSTINSQSSIKNQTLDIGFKVYRLTTSNFKKYTPVSGQDKEAENSLFKELEGNLVPLVVV